MNIYLCVASSINQRNAIEARIKTWHRCFINGGFISYIVSIEKNMLVEKSSDSIFKRAFKTIISSIYFQFLLLKKFRVKDAIYIFSSPPFLPAAISALLCIVFRKRYIFEVRDPYPRLFWESGLISKSNIIIKILHRLESYIYKNAQTIIVTDYFNSLDEFVLHSNNITIVLNGAYNKFKGKNKNFKNSLNICHLGRMGKFQNSIILDNEIDQLISNKEINSINFIGDSYKENKAKINNIGRVNPEIIQDKLSDFDIGLSFRSDDKSSDLNIPIRIYEYLNAGMCVRSNRTFALESYENDLKKMFGFSPFSFIEDESIADLIRRLRNERNDFNLLKNNFLRYDNMKKFIRSDQLK